MSNYFFRFVFRRRVLTHKNPFNSKCVKNHALLTFGRGWIACGGVFNLEKKNSTMATTRAAELCRKGPRWSIPDTISLSRVTWSCQGKRPYNIKRRHKKIPGRHSSNRLDSALYGVITFNEITCVRHKAPCDLGYKYQKIPMCSSYIFSREGGC